MKNKITCLLAGAALFGATANADIVLADGLTAYGYIDMNTSDAEGGAREADFTEYEIGLSFTPAESQWSAVVELSYLSSAANTTFETAAVTYQYSDALSFTAGNVLSYQGLESYDAPNNNFISYAGQGPLYSAGYAEGVSADYSAGDITLGAWASAGGSADFEYYAAYSGIDNLTLSVALADNNSAGLEGSETTNLMAVYELGDFTLSYENVDSSGFGDADPANASLDLDVDVFAIAYSMGDTTVALRLSDGTIDGADFEKTSIAAFHSLSDNVAAGVEYSDEDGEANVISAELLYVF